MTDPRTDTSTSSPYRPSLDEDLDPRYTTESYQQQQPPPPPSNTHHTVVFDATSHDHSPSHGFPSSTVPPVQPAWSVAGPPRLSDHSSPFAQSFNTSQSWSLSSVCAIAWALPPFTSLIVLVWETESDLARFHAYQSGILGGALLVALWLVRSVLGLKTIGLLMGMAALGWFWVCGTDHRLASSRSVSDATNVQLDGA
ncbi:uncharacterized protein PSFLO_07164 [Pseudozyma flocculosa]|uniref:Uncharacterized protein n=1 Tax=Pseudozyma flocculosa TaxID=84751 RepID=A0A5C3FBD0_9BASI|nr:uncharacterized protein PSFLO_07164 [Pseudozyma flocculosa]